MWGNAPHGHGTKGRYTSLFRPPSIEGPKQHRGAVGRSPTAYLLTAPRDRFDRSLLRRICLVVSVNPCEGHGKRISGKLDWLRLTVTSGASKWTRPMRLCSVCLDSRLDDLGTAWTALSLENDSPVGEVCCACLEPCPTEFGRASLFATSIRQGDRTDWFGYYCGPCATRLVAEQHLQVEP